MKKREIVLYTTEDGRSRIKLRAEEGTVWLTQFEMAEFLLTSYKLFSLGRSN